MKYDPKAIEKKWRSFWKIDKTFKALDNFSLPKYYVLDMFPYPSGAGLHVGHLIGYTATDILARYKRHQGYNVLHPMGWDSFGLPAEQYAIRTGTHPAITTHTNIKKFRQQLEAVGYAYDWDREISTCEPSYYRWTQWIFTKLFEKGLAYQADLLVNYCEALGTVLANEEVEAGRSKEGGHPIQRRPLKQWVLKITAYADRLLNDLEGLDWPEGLKKLQRHWIGRSVGATITFPVEKGGEIEVFTTRPDTLFGVSYLVLSPEHPLVDQVTIESHKETMHHYRKEALSKSDLERTELAQEKSGCFTGSYALHPVTNEKIPIWVGDYVLLFYGTGAVMAVPAHDERDFAFATRYHLPVKPVVIPEKMAAEVKSGTLCWEGEGRIENSCFGTLSLDGLTSKEAKERLIGWLEKEGKGKKTISYRLRDWLFSRQRYWGEPFPIVHYADGSLRALGLDELPLTPPEIVDFKPSSTGESPLARAKDWVEIIDAKSGKKAFRETNTMPQWAGSCWYYLRFLDPHNTESAWDLEKEKYWMMVDLYVGGAEHAVLHLLYARFWHKVLYDCGLVSTPEPFQRLLNQGLVVSRSYQRINGSYLSEDEVVEKDGCYLHWETGEALRSQIEKMSKSKLNGVSPDEIIEEFGADSLRLYSMFMGPIDKEKVWNTDGVSGCRRFLNRFYEMVTSEKVSEGEAGEATTLCHKLVKQVTEDIDNLLFNTAIAKMMEFVTAMIKQPLYPKEGMKMATIILSPFAPHIAEELWSYLGEKSTIAHAAWPKANPEYLVEAMVTYVVQVNGKLRGRFELPLNQSEEVIVRLAKENQNIAKHLTKEVQKIVFIPNKLLNFVLE